MERIFLKAGMGERLEYGEKYGRGIFCARQGEKVLEYSEEALRGYLLGKYQSIWYHRTIILWKCSRVFRMEKSIGSS